MPVGMREAIASCAFTNPHTPPPHPHLVPQATLRDTTRLLLVRLADDHGGGLLLFRPPPVLDKEVNVLALAMLERRWGARRAGPAASDGWWRLRLVAGCSRRFQHQQVPVWASHRAALAPAALAPAALTPAARRPLQQLQLHGGGGAGAAGGAPRGGGSGCAAQIL